MCLGISAIATLRGQQKLYFKSGVNSHSDIREEFGLKDDKPNEQVNLEAHLLGDFFNIKDWKIVVDHDQANVPQWFIDDKPLIQDLFIAFIEDEIKATKSTGTYKGSLDLSYLKSGKGIILPKKMGGNLYLSGLTSAEGLVLPKTIGGGLSLNNLTSASGLVLPQEIGGVLILNNLTSASGLVLPKTIGGNLYLNSLTSASGLVLPKKMGGYLDLSGLKAKEKEEIREKGYRVF